MIKERPILFSAPMVRAILNGRKSQTRRVISPSNIRIMLGGFDSPGRWIKPDYELLEAALTNARNFRRIEHLFAWESDPAPHQISAAMSIWTGKPIYSVENRLWIRETWHYDNDLDEYFYKADSDVNVKWKPSIHMPRIASRILLEITNVRIERLNDISEEDAIAEGCVSTAVVNEAGDDYSGEYPSEVFRRLWQSIHGPGSWDINPRVWVIEFRKI